jgi:hypothetical protein
MKQSKNSILVIGGGISGLLAATILHDAGFSVTVLDKGKGIGGRLATRRIEDDQYGLGVFDYGAQFFSAHDPSFLFWVNRWLERKVIQKWSDGFLTESKEMKSTDIARYRGIVSNRDIAKQLATRLEVHTNTRVTGFFWENNQWNILTAENQIYYSDGLLLTPPLPQSMELLTASNIKLAEDTRLKLESVRYLRCMALLVLLKDRSGIPEPGGVWLSGEPASWLADNTIKGISPDGYAVTIHTGPKFSEDNWEAENEWIFSKLANCYQKWIRSEVAQYQVHRWKYSQPVSFYGEPFLHLKTPGDLILTGDGFMAGRMEGSALSGIKAAEYIINTVTID